VWNTLEAAWDKGFRYLETYHTQHGDCLTPTNFRVGNFNLGIWVNTQRGKKNTLSTERLKLLNSLGFVWNSLETAWDEGFRYLETYHAQHGDCLVPKNFRVDDFKLGNWVNNQRGKKNTLSKERLKLLNSLGFVWNTLEAAWDKGFRYLETYHTQHGDCLVSQRAKIGDFNLGTWVNNQRRLQNTLSKERLERLNSLGFVWTVRKEGK